jgi:hypothetical protein
MNTKKYEMKNRAFDSEKGGGCSFFSLFYYDTLKQLLSDQQFFTPLLTLQLNSRLAKILIFRFLKIQGR